MKIKKIMPLFAIAMGLVLAMATSAFKEMPKESFSSTFYEYVGTDFSQTNIQEISNYVRSTNSCSGTKNVCGVLLPTDNGPSSNPDPAEFSGEASNLWLSQQNQAAADPNIVMKK